MLPLAPLAKELFSRLKAGYISLAVIHFRWLVAAHFISFAGTTVQLGALEWWVKQKTTEPAALAGLRCSALIGVVLAGLIGSFLADRFDHRKTLLWIQFAGAVQALALLGVFFYGFSLNLVFALSFLGWIAAGFDSCIRNPLNMSIVGDKNAHSSFGVTLQAAQMAALLGYFAAGQLLVRCQNYGEIICFALNALSFAAPIAALVLIGRKHSAESHDSRAPRLPALQLLRQSLAVQTIREIFLQSGLGCSFSMYNPIFLTIFAQNVFAGNAETFAALYMAWVLGKLVGCIISGSITKNHNQVAGWALVAQAPILVFFALSPNYYWAMFFIATGSVLNHLLFNLNAVQVAVLVDRANRGSITSMRVSICCGLECISVFTAGRLAGIYGVQTTTAAYGVVGLGASVLLLCYSLSIRKPASLQRTAF